MLSKRQHHPSNSITSPTPIEIVFEEDKQNSAPSTQAIVTQAQNQNKNYKRKQLEKKRFNKSRKVNKSSRRSLKRTEKTSKKSLSISPSIGDLERNKNAQTALSMRSKEITKAREGDSPLDLNLPANWTNKITTTDAVTSNLDTTSIPKSWKKLSDGSYTVNKPGFIITVKEDGSVQFKDAPDIALRIAYPSPKALKIALKEWFKKPKKYAKKYTPKKLRQFTADDFDSLVVGAPIPIPILVGAFNPDTAIIRLLGEDPFIAARLKFMKETREIRFKMATESKQHNKSNARFQAKQRLQAVWNDNTLSAKRRRSILFELWDESNESEGGIFIKDSIVGFINKTIPRHSRHAFTPEEIRLANRSRQSSMRFDPYL